MIYKVISKIIANRLKEVLKKFIGPFQGAFLPGKLIQDNNVIAHELFHTMKKKTGRVDGIEAGYGEGI